jgi:glutamate--cysteine ligase
VLDIARGGLSRRRCLDGQGRDESRFLDPLDEIAQSGRCPAEILLGRYDTEWGGSVEPAFRTCVF